MKRFTSLFAIVTLIGLTAFLFFKNYRGDKSTYDFDTLYSVQSYDSVQSYEIPSESKVNTDTLSSGYKIRTMYPNKSVIQFGNICVDPDSGPEENDTDGDDLFLRDASYLSRYINGERKETMLLVGPYNRRLGKGHLCQIVVGVDTVNIDIRQPFHKRIDLRYKDAIPGCKYYRFSKHHELEIPYICPYTDFQINIAMPDNTPMFIKDFISEMICDDVENFFSDYDLETKEYIYSSTTNNRNRAPHIPVFNLQNESVYQMSQYYYKQFCKYFDLFCFAPISYQLYAYPVWQNSDTTLTTWKFYTYKYAGGAHGGEFERFLTFENATGRILGTSDFFSKEMFKDAIKNLTRQLNAYHGVENRIRAEYDQSEILSVISPTYTEVINGKHYPRPALTKQGIVFSYQVLEKGAICDGVLHFTQPYPQDLKIRR